MTHAQTCLLDDERLTPEHREVLRILTAGRSTYPSRSEFARAGQRDLYSLLTTISAHRGGHHRIAAEIGLPLQVGGRPCHVEESQRGR
jgi:hypothetical protein